MKVFRKITPGVNPDIAVHEVLTRAGSEHVAALYGWLDVDDRRPEPLQLAMLQQFLRTASDGWDLALASVRNLFAEPELHAHESGGDFAGESTRLGEALREVHEALREHFPSETRPAAAAAELAAIMTGRLEAALAVVPELAEHAKRRCGRRSTTSPSSTASTSSGSTATCTSARPCAPRSAGRSSTSRASRPSRSPSGCCRTRRGATWPGCCAPSTTPPAWSSGR